MRCFPAMADLLSERTFSALYEYRRSRMTRALRAPAPRLAGCGLQCRRRAQEHRQRHGQEDGDADNGERSLDAVEVADEAVAQGSSDAAQRAQRVEGGESAREAVFLDEIADGGVEHRG